MLDLTKLFSKIFEKNNRFRHYIKIVKTNSNHLGELVEQTEKVLKKCETNTQILSTDLPECLPESVQR